MAKEKREITTHREMDDAVDRMFNADRPRELDDRLVKIFARTPWWPFMFVVLSIPFLGFGYLFYTLSEKRLGRYVRVTHDLKMDNQESAAFTETQATITWAGGIHAKRDNSEDIFRVVYRFNDQNGVERISEGYLTRSAYKNPEKLELPIQYITSDPSLNRPVGGTRAYPDALPYAILTLIFFLAPFVGTGFTVLFRNMEIRRYLRQGVAVKVKVTDIAVGLPLLATMIMDVEPMGGEQEDRFRMYSPRLKRVHPVEAMTLVTEMEYIRVLVIPHKKKTKIKALALEAARLVDPNDL